MPWIKRNLVIVCVWVGCCSLSHAQHIKPVFDEGKRLFDQEQYALALSKLAPLTSLEIENDWVRYASYYYAVSAYYSGDLVMAKNMFLQVLRKYPSWDKNEEVNYWLALLSFENDEPRDAMNYLTAIRSDTFQEDIHALKTNYFRKITAIDTLQDLLAAYPEEQALASQLVEQILLLEVQEQDIDLLMELSDSYQLSVNLALDGIEASPKKEVYNVGLFMPFRFQYDSVGIERAVNSWTVRFWEGIRLGVSKLLEEGIRVNLLAFDTRQSAGLTHTYLSQPGISELDLIIGPVYQGPVQAVSAFSREHKINMLNPLSSNGDIIKDNPFAFLYYPGNESLAIAAAEYTRKHLTRNKNAAIFYSGFGDRPRAELYRKLIEEDSFNVVIFDRISPAESVNIQQLLVEEEELEKDSAVVAGMMAEMDSLREAEVKDWEIYHARDFVYDTLKILPDSIGHIFIASDISSLSASAISGIDARPDTIAYIGPSRWLSSEQSISFEQLERLGAVFTGSNWIDYDTATVKEFRERYEAAFMAYPKKDERLGDAYLGYDIMVTYGRLLYQYGKYFQLGLRRKASVRGELTEAFDYRLSNDNRFIPIFKIKNAQVEKSEKE